jgi:hypothetical protein
LESRTCPNSGVRPGSISSSPVERITTRGFGYTGTRANPAAARIPSSGAARRRLAFTRRSPTVESSPAGRTCLPDGIASSTRTTSPPTTQFSIGTTQSAPAGTGAPVSIRTASFPPTTASGRRPIRARPTTRSSTGDPGAAETMSMERTANPSMAEDENAGISSWARMSAARTPPRASWRCRSSGRSGSIADSTRSW